MKKVYFDLNKNEELLELPEHNFISYDESSCFRTKRLYLDDKKYVIKSYGNYDLPMSFLVMNDIRKLKISKRGVVSYHVKQKII